MDGKCETCQHWGAKTDWDAESSSTESRHCGSPKIRYIQGSLHSSPMAPDEAWYWDTDDYSATFETGPEFGCIHHEMENG
jgi:hypothetical protein